MAEEAPRTADEADTQFLVGLALAATFVGAEHIEANLVVGGAWLAFALLLYRMSVRLSSMKTVIGAQLHDVVNNPFMLFLVFALFLGLVYLSNLVAPYRTRFYSNLGRSERSVPPENARMDIQGIDLFHDDNAHQFFVNIYARNNGQEIATDEGMRVSCSLQINQKTTPQLRRSLFS